VSAPRGSPCGRVDERGLAPALREGRQAARAVDEYLMGVSDLPR